MFRRPLKVVVFRNCIKFLRVFAVSRGSNGTVKIDDDFNIARKHKRRYEKLISTQPFYDPIWWFRF